MVTACIFQAHPLGLAFFQCSAGSGSQSSCGLESAGSFDHLSPGVGPKHQDLKGLRVIPACRQSQEPLLLDGSSSSPPPGIGIVNIPDKQEAKPQ